MQNMKYILAQKLHCGFMTSWLEEKNSITHGETLWFVGRLKSRFDKEFLFIIFLLNLLLSKIAKLA